MDGWMDGRMDGWIEKSHGTVINYNKATGKNFISIIV